MIKDKRRYPRVRQKILLEVHKKKLVFFKGSKASGQVIDVSKTGTKLLTTLGLNRGDLVALTVKGGRASALKDFNGNVVWAKEVKKGAKKYTLAGIEFKKLDSAQTDFLMNLAYGG